MRGRVIINSAIVAVLLSVSISSALHSQALTSSPSTSSTAIIDNESEGIHLSRFIPSLWVGYDSTTRRLRSDLVDPGTLIRAITLSSFISSSAENVIGPVVGLRTVGLGWIWKLRGSNSYYLGIAIVVETDLLFEPGSNLKAIPAITISLPGLGRRGRDENESTDEDSEWNEDEE